VHSNYTPGTHHGNMHNGVAKILVDLLFLACQLWHPRGRKN
jgi:hypothetical protein